VDKDGTAHPSFAVKTSQDKENTSKSLLRREIYEK